MMKSELKRSAGDMAGWFDATWLSSHIGETKEGFLVCLDVPITRSGDFLYAPGEVEQSAVLLRRPLETLIGAVASAEGKPVTLEHPDTADRLLTSEDWRDYVVGAVSNVRMGEYDKADKMLADLVIYDADVAASIRAGEFREVSIGYRYDVDFSDDQTEGVQTALYINHVALVKNGRAGAECAITDAKPDFKLNERTDNMTANVDEKGFFEAMKSFFLGEDQPNPQTDQTAGDEKPVSALPEQVAALTQRVADLATKVEGLLKAAGDGEPEPEQQDPETQEAGTDGKPEPETVKIEYDADTLARAEILAPGIAADSVDLKQRALDAYAASADGKAMVTNLSHGTITESNIDAVFVAASEIVKVQRTAALAAADHKPASTAPQKARTSDDLIRLVNTRA